MASQEPRIPALADNGPMVSGKVVILGVFGFSVAAALVSWVYYARLQERPLALWGSQAAALLLRAPKARAYRLAPAADVGEESTNDSQSARRQFVINGERYVATRERDISQARGFSHIRQGLVHDRSFAWDEPPGDQPLAWEYAIEFEDAGQTAVVAFANHAVRAALVDSKTGDREHADATRTVSTRPVSVAIDTFLAEQFPSEPQSIAP